MHVVDNFLENSQFKMLTDIILGPDFNWFFNPCIATSESNGYYFTHTFYDEGRLNSDFLSAITPILTILNPKQIVRIKANMYPSSDTLEKHGMHTDLDTPCHGAVFYVNDNDGYTELEDGTKIKSIANRILLFDPTKPHQSTSCTDANVRVTINFNYF